MKDTDTPETEKARAEYLETIWTSGARITKDLVPIEHARRLERERDEARAYAEADRDACLASYKLPWEEGYKKPD